MSSDPGVPTGRERLFLILATLITAVLGTIFSSVLVLAPAPLAVLFVSPRVANRYYDRSFVRNRRRRIDATSNTLDTDSLHVGFGGCSRRGMA